MRGKENSEVCVVRDFPKMKRIFLLSLAVTIVFITIYVVMMAPFQKPTDEAFQDAPIEVLDRANPLARNQNPLKNPAVKIGISDSDAANLRNLTLSAFGKNPTGAANVGLRIDTESSFLGMVKFCKDAGKGPNPFSDPAFAKNCGMCLSPGTLITGETFTTPTGVLVYEKDKEIAYSKQKKNKYPFPRAIPSMKSATCTGASFFDDVQPTLAIDEKTFKEFRKRKACRDTHQIGNECGICQSNKEYSWFSGAADSIRSLKLLLWGTGFATVSTGGSSQVVVLSEKKASIISIGKALEGQQILIDVSDTDPSASASASAVKKPLENMGVYGVLSSTLPNDKPYNVPLEIFLEKDRVSGSFPRRSNPIFVAELSRFLTRFIPQGQTTQTSQSKMALEGVIPLTFMESDQLATFDCPASPFITKQSSAELFINDPCLNPKGQGVGNYSTECIRSLLLVKGVSSEGSWYKNVNSIPIKNYTKEQLMSWLDSIQSKVSRSVDYSMGVLGVDISTPCDTFIGTEKVPNKKCLVYLYSNESSQSNLIGTGYPGVTNKYTSLNGSQTIQFCQKSGLINPVESEGEAELINASLGYKGVKGVAAVKMFLSDLFTKATGNLDVNLEDAEGGRKTSWSKCFGIKLSDPKIMNVRKNAKGDVLSSSFEAPTFANLPTNPRLIQNQQIGKIVSTGDYTLSFDITPKGIVQGWGNVVHFSQGGDMGNGYRMPGIWFIPGTLRFHVRIGDVSDSNWGFDTDAIPLNQKSSFRLICKGRSIILTINSKVYQATQPRARFTGQCTVWASDPWYSAAVAILENLKYQS